MKAERHHCRHCGRVLSFAAYERGEWTWVRGYRSPHYDVAVHVDDCERMTLQKIRIAAQLRREAERA
jgi:hypothetical protein